MGFWTKLFGRSGVRAEAAGLAGNHDGTAGRDRVTAEAKGLIDNGDGTLTDHATGLMWQKDDDGVPRTQEEAFAYCSSLTLGGFGGWRLPELGQFQSLEAAVLDRFADFQTASSSGVYAGYSPNGNLYWTATDPPPGLPSNVAYAADGTTFYRTNKYYVRAVRRCP